MYELVQNPRAQDVVRREVDRLLPNGESLLDLPEEECYQLLSTGLVETKAIVLEVRACGRVCVCEWGRE